MALITNQLKCNYICLVLTEALNPEEGGKCKFIKKQALRKQWILLHKFLIQACLIQHTS